MLNVTSVSNNYQYLKQIPVCEQIILTDCFESTATIKKINNVSVLIMDSFQLTSVPNLHPNILKNVEMETTTTESTMSTFSREFFKIIHTPTAITMITKKSQVIVLNS